MDVTVDLYLAVPLLFTVLALVLASVFVRLRGGEGERAAERPGEPSIPRQPPAEPREPGQREDAESKIPPLGASPGSSLGHTEQVEDGCGHAALSKAAFQGTKAEEEDLDSENEKLVVREPEDEDAADETFSFKYSPGKLRGNQYKSMMTKEELEEEQRVQREQLAAIFRLMKEKSDTFGEMSEGDMKEQLRLYDI
ncbi:PREDICTED: matrix-remodeling-associated protein 7 [Haliaeetus leucocephalus]|uniref:matrix-remodeling-associated protein 7 n=1 Tax=Haliaeetus leucocephalus TaxID=52644 RepID=UPI00053CCBBE|nr:PREDICTED: matrix-remodeling-associated protein 7 [Haliaeetus leucocephalus]